jgi:probable rRNA maturation factor
VSPSPTQATEVNPSEDEGILVQVDEEFADRVDANDLVAAVTATLEAEDRQGEVTVVITTDEAVAELNEQYREAEGPTDVLSFPAQDSSPGFVSAPEMAGYLGDIIIALPFTERQAAALNRPLAAELRLLAVHGVLHLLGYDHAEPDEEAQMWARQDAILARFL